jgi:DNA-3-methyladenine glycosylase I
VPRNGIPAVTSAEPAGPLPGPDGLLRCPWALRAPDYLRYHDAEWGKLLRSDRDWYERLSLEAFQSGLSWLTILRKRENFRAAFDGFDPEIVAGYDDRDVARLLADSGLVRNRAKIAAAIQNARATVALGDGGLTAVVLAAAPGAGRAVPLVMSDVPAATPESLALAQRLRGVGFRFVGPVTAYALMQAGGVVDDHLRMCVVRARNSPLRAMVPSKSRDLG